MRFTVILLNLWVHIPYTVTKDINSCITMYRSSTNIQRWGLFYFICFASTGVYCFFNFFSQLWNKFTIFRWSWAITNNCAHVSYINYSKEDISNILRLPFGCVPIFMFCMFWFFLWVEFLLHGKIHQKIKGKRKKTKKKQL